LFSGVGIAQGAGRRKLAGEIQGDRKTTMVASIPRIMTTMSASKNISSLTYLCITFFKDLNNL